MTRSQQVGWAFLWLLVTSLILTLPFWLTDLDMQVSGKFYDPDASRAFPLKYEPFWYALYKLIPVLSGLVAVGCITSFIASFLSPKYCFLRKPAVAVFLSFILGPGLVVNGIFKEHYGRPRPAQVEDFGGQYTYVKPWVYGGYKNAKSFPSGHSSVGFAFIIFFLMWRKRYPVLAKASLALTLLLGSLTGMARIVGGGHFLSDVLWSFSMVTAVALWVNYWVLTRNPSPSDPATPNQKRAALAGASLLLAGIIGYTLASLPFSTTEKKTFSWSPSQKLQVDMPYGKYTVRYEANVEPAIDMTTEGYGFLPLVDCEIQITSETEVLRIESDCRGLFTEILQRGVIILPEK